MSIKQNCWEYKNCGRQPGGYNVPLLGVCPAATDVSSSGLNNGHNGGRICWAVKGAFCGGKIQDTFAQKKMHCMRCEFFKLVKKKEGSEKFVIEKPDQKYNNIYKIFLYLM